MKDILAIIAMSPYFDNVTLTRSSLRGILTEEVLNGLDAEADLIKEGEILPVQGRTFA